MEFLIFVMVFAGILAVVIGLVSGRSGRTAADDSHGTFSMGVSDDADSTHFHHHHHHHHLHHDPTHHGSGDSGSSHHGGFDGGGSGGFDGGGSSGGGCDP